MIRVDPFTFYETEEVRSILRGRIKIDTLRAHGLRGLSNGYWGGNLIDAIDRFCVSITYVERGTGTFSEEEVRHAIFDNSDRAVSSNTPEERQLPMPRKRERPQGNEVFPMAEGTGALESLSERFLRRTKKNPIPGDNSRKRR